MPSPESNFFTGIKFEPKKRIAMPQHTKPSPFDGVLSPELDGFASSNTVSAALRIGAALDGAATDFTEPSDAPGAAADADTASAATRRRAAGGRIGAAVVDFD